MDTGTVIVVIFGAIVLIGGFIMISNANAATVKAQALATSQEEAAAAAAATNPNNTAGLSIPGLGSVSNSALNGLFNVLG